MNLYLMQFRRWYELRDAREKILVLLLGCVIMYSFFYFIFFRILDKKEDTLLDEIKVLSKQKNNWQIQIDALQKISQSPLYKKWMDQHVQFQRLQGKYQNIMQSSSTKQWQDIISTILKSQNNVVLAQIKNFPEKLFNPSNLPANASKIYQQDLLVVLYSNYFDTINYLVRLEQQLPNIYWNKVSYEVVNYPMAKVQMEFSIFYEKN